jgi:two-component system cell cycle response regulator DivK
MYAAYLDASGFRVAKARDGVEAIKVAKQLQPAVVVLDVQMPRLDGIAATRRIRQDPKIGTTPILVLTAYDTHEEAALAAGANAVCVKPCSPDALTTQIQRLLTQKL